MKHVSESDSLNAKGRDINIISTSGVWRLVKMLHKPLSQFRLVEFKLHFRKKTKTEWLSLT